MKNLAIAVPWVFVLVLTGVVIAQYRNSNSFGEGVREPVARDTAPRPVDFESDLAQRVEDLTNENEHLQELVSHQTAELDSLANELQRATEMIARASVDEPAPMIEENRRAMTEQMAELQVQRRYGAFLAGLGLPPEREAQIREALLRIFVDAGNDPSLTEIDRSTLLTQELASLLSPKELDEFEEYEEALPEQMLRQALEGQVDTMSAGLSDPTRALLVDVLVEEMLVASLTPAPEGATAAYPLIQRMNAYANTAARFDGVLNDAEAAALNRFLDQQYAQLQTTVSSIERAEAAGGTAIVDVQAGSIRVEIEQSE